MITPALAVLVALLGVAIIWATLTYNALMRSGLQVDEAWSTVAIQLKRRASLVPNLVETVAGYVAHERETLAEVARARARLESGAAPPEATAANAALTAALGRLFAVVEAYPELKASQQFIELQKELSGLEDKIAFARQFYNRTTLEFNARVSTLPSSVIAAAMGVGRRPFFEPDDASIETPKVRFRPPAQAA